MNKNLFPIAKEGLNYVGISLVVTLLFVMIDFDILAFISFMVFISCIYFFRNPERELHHFQEGSLLSISDGVVKSIEELSDSEYAYKIEIEGSCSSVALLRSPSLATVESISIVKGCRVSKNSKLFSQLNEKATLLFKDNKENNFKVEFTLKNSFAPIMISLVEGQKLQQAQRFGVMVNGLTTLYLPANFRVNVSAGNTLKASESLIGYFS